MRRRSASLASAMPIPPDPISKGSPAPRPETCNPAEPVPGSDGSGLRRRGGIFGTAIGAAPTGRAGHPAFAGTAGIGRGFGGGPIGAL